MQSQSEPIFNEQNHQDLIHPPKPFYESKPFVQSLQINPQSDQDQSITIIRLPFNTKSIKKLTQTLTPQIIQKIQENQESINLSLNFKTSKPFYVNLFKKKLIRPMQMLKTKKLIHKKTGKTIKIIINTSNISLLYDYEELGDFINTMGTQTLYGHKNYSLKQQDLLTSIKTNLSQNIHSTNQLQNDVYSNDKFLPLIQPLSYLRNYNFVPPLCDMLTNKIKPNAQQNQIVAKSINYEEQVPQSPNVQAPKFISQSLLYKKITAYMEKRPCWLKNSLYFALYQEDMKDKFTISDFKNVMKYSAYTFRNGPWKHTFCKFGFDPKKQFKSIIYQSIALKLKEKEVQDYENQIEEQVYDPTFQQISNRFIRSYQLCDIGNQAIREIVQGKLISKEDECTKQHGWLNVIEHGKVMKIMKARVQQSIKIPG